MLLVYRKLEQEEDALGMIKDKLNMKEWEIVTVIHKQNRSPCDLAMWLRGTDVLVTPHGFQSMLLLFLSVNTKVFSTDMKSQQSLTGEPVRPSVLFEIFPYRYFKRAYGPLSKELGLCICVATVVQALIYVFFVLRYSTL